MMAHFMLLHQQKVGIDISLEYSSVIPAITVYDAKIELAMLVVYICFVHVW